MAFQVGPGLARVAVAVTDVPFICQITGVPLDFWNSRSASPSPLKSPVPIRLQESASSGLGSVAVAITDVPFISQIIGVPLGCWNTRSDLPSPLKSPVPIRSQVLPGFPSIVVEATD